MRASPLSLLIVSIWPIAGSLVVLALAAVGRGIWISHLLAVCFGCSIVFVGSYLSKLGNPRITAFAIIALTFLCLAIPLLGGESSGPQRWVSVGPVRLYLAPLLLPSFIAACSALAGQDSKHQIFTSAAVLLIALLLALQPDASQVLGLAVAFAVVAAKRQPSLFWASVVVFLLVAITVWAFSIPDPLEPVPYVEEVFALALGHSLFAGVVVITSAIILVVGLWVQSFNGPYWLSAVASYYLVLFVCSTTGITPAPLVGYGAGPILGFGLMAGLLGWLERKDCPERGSRDTDKIIS